VSALELVRCYLAIGAAWLLYNWVGSALQHPEFTERVASSPRLRTCKGIAFAAAGGILGWPFGVYLTFAPRPWTAWFWRRFAPIVRREFLDDEYGERLERMWTDPPPPAPDTIPELEQCDACGTLLLGGPRRGPPPEVLEAFADYPRCSVCGFPVLHVEQHPAPVPAVPPERPE
jgi:hypothetical protein